MTMPWQTLVALATSLPVVQILSLERRRNAMSVVVRTGVATALSAVLIWCSSAPRQSTRVDHGEPSHFVDRESRPLPEYEWIWTRLGEVYADSMPERVVVNFTDGDGGYFDPTGDQVHLSRSLFAEGPAHLLAHEASHLCLAHLTRGASDEEAFRFLDEGFAEIVSHRIAGDLDDYKQEALPEASVQQRKGNVSFARVGAWSSYFGNWKNAPINPNHSPYAHYVGASFDFMVIDRYGEATLLELFRSLGRTRSLEQSARIVLHEELPQLQEDWQAYLLAVALPPAPHIVELVPTAGATSVPTRLSELRVVFDVPMSKRIGVSSSCEPEVSYKNAYWKDPKTLAIRVPAGLQPGRTCHLRLSPGSFPFRSRLGAELATVDWTFATQ